MYWLTYVEDEEGRLLLRIVKSEHKPEGNVLNHGARDPQKLLALFALFLRVDAAGFTHVKKDMDENAPHFKARVGLAFRIEPFLAYLTALAIFIGILALILASVAIIHVMGSLP